MAYLYPKLTAEQIDNMYKDILQLADECAEIDDVEDRIETTIQDESFSKHELLILLRTAESNPITFMADIKMLLILYLSKENSWMQFVGVEERERLLDKYIVYKKDFDAIEHVITLSRISEIFPAMTCNILLSMPQIQRPIGVPELPVDFPRSLMCRSFFSVLPKRPILGKLKLIKAALLYNLLEDAKFKPIMNENYKISYLDQLLACIKYASNDYKSDYVTSVERENEFKIIDLQLMKSADVIDCSIAKLESIVGYIWNGTICNCFDLSGIDLN